MYYLFKKCRKFPPRKVGIASQICKFSVENPAAFGQLIVKNTLVNPSLFLKDLPKLVGDGWGVLGVRLRVGGVFTTINPSSDAPNILRTETRKKKKN